MRSSDSEEIVIDYRSEGDAIGFLSLYSGDRSRTDVTAVEDTTCYLMPREPFLALLEAHPEVREYFHRTFLAKYMDKAFTDMRSRSQLFGSGEKLLFTTAVGDLITHPVVTASRDVSIRAAAQLMSHHGISSLVLVDGDTVPIGIITDRDLRDKVAARGRDTAEPVANIMSTSLIKADAADYCFEALLTMLRHNIHHLLVVDEGRLRGIVTNHDLLILQGTSPISVVREIEGPDRPRRARAGRRQGRRHRRAAAQGRRPRRQHHPHHHRDQRPARAQGDRVRAAQARAGAAALVLARLRQRGAPRADLRDRPGQRPRLRRPGAPRRRRRRRASGSRASPAS